MSSGSNFCTFPWAQSAALVTQAIAETISLGEHGSTFGGGPVACAAALATLEVLTEENLVAQARETGAYLKDKLARLEGVKSVRGLGLLLGVETAAQAKPLQGVLLEMGVLAGTSADPHVLRLLPPLIAQETHADAFVSALRTALDQLAEG